ncbi:MAG: hypothetical protein BroJett013_07210 [Alphaproteobacteria bacterium]|nr:MAG: hypothetical protein BroJett013_07210 [Alphaproteobacteria bacterium]
MKLLFVAIFATAILIQVWKRLSEQSRAAIVSKAKAMLNQIQSAGRKLREKVFRRRIAYRNAFLNEHGELNPTGRIILAHLTKFCYALSTTAMGGADEATRNQREGRRQVWLEIMRELNIDPSQALSAVREEELLAA